MATHPLPPLDRLNFYHVRFGFPLPDIPRTEFVLRGDHSHPFIHEGALSTWQAKEVTQKAVVRRTRHRASQLPRKVAELQMENKALKVALEDLQKSKFDEKL